MIVRRPRGCWAAGRVATVLLALALGACGRHETGLKRALLGAPRQARPARSVSAGGDALQVRRISPSGQAIEPGRELVIQFDRAMVALGAMARKPQPLDVSVRPDPGCQWRWLDTSELACRLPGKQRFAPATNYTVRVGTGLRALDGNHLARPVTGSFSTWRPQIQWVEFQRWESPVTPLYLLHFNVPVTAQAAQRSVFFSDGHGDGVAARIEPFTRRREGPLWLPVPGAPGAVLEVVSPRPDRPLDAKAAAAAGRRVWLARPARALQGGRNYALRLRAGLLSALGPLPGVAADLYTTASTYGEFSFQGVSCGDGHGDHFQWLPGAVQSRRCRPGSVNLLFSAPVPRATLAAIGWQPDPLAPGQLARHWADYPDWFLRPRNSDADATQPDSYPLTFRLQPMHDYVLRVPAGVRDRFGRRLARSVELRFQTGHDGPFLDPPPALAVLESGLHTIVPLRFTNLQSLTLHERRLFAADLEHDRAAAPERAQDLLQRKDLAPRLDKQVRGSLGVRRLLDGRSGVLWGRLRAVPPLGGASTRLMAEVTPYQVLAKIGHYDSLIWLSRLADGRPVAGARVALYTTPRADPGRPTRVGPPAVLTDAQGLARLPGSATLPKDWFDPWQRKREYFVGVTRGRQLALLPLNDAFTRTVLDASHYSLQADNQAAHGHMRAWAVTGQGIYKPGSEVRYIAFVRAEGPTELRAPPRLDYALRITDATGKVVLRRQHVRLSEFGSVSGELHVGRNAASGQYSISLSWPTANGTVTRDAGGFLVTDFVPASYQVHTSLRQKVVGPGSLIGAQASATLQAGGPYADAAVKFTTTLVAAPFAPDNPLAAGFQFGGSDGDTDTLSTRTVSMQQLRLDHAGRASMHLRLPAVSGTVYGQVVVEAAVESARATWVARSAQAVYAARDRFIGLRTDNWLQTAGQPFSVQYLVVDPQGTPRAGSRVRLLLQRQRIDRVQLKNGAGDFAPDDHVSWVTEDRCAATASAAPGHCSLTPRHAGDYRIEAEVDDTRGRVDRAALETWVTGPGEVLWSQGRGVTIVPDRKAYHVGDTAHLLIQNPFPGARALVTVERYGVLWKKLLTLHGGAPVVNLPIRADFFPGAYVSVAVFSPRVAPPADPDLGKPALALGYMALPVLGPGGALQVQVSPDAPQHKPRQQVDVAVRVRHAGGAVAPGTRLVAVVVDQSVVDLLQQGLGYYDPSSTFQAPPQGPDITNYSLAEQLVTRLQPRAGKGESPGGDGGASVGPNMRSDFRYAVYWNDQLRTDARGRAHFRFTLPDNLTRWRIVVIAMGRRDAMGLGKSSVRVDLPLELRQALPNQVRVGDAFDAGFSVTNRTQGALRVLTHLQARGPIAGASAAADSTLQLGSFAHGLSWLRLHADAPGSIELQADARAGALSDAMRARVAVAQAQARVVAAEYGSTIGPAAQIALQAPAAALPGSARVQLQLAPTLVGGLDGAFEVLRDDLLQTWEIRLSRGVLASDYLRLGRALGATLAWPDAAGEVQRTLEAAGDFQAPDGGMAFWIPNDRFVSPYLSVYTALAFHWLHQAGHAIPQDVQAALQGYLRRHVLDAAHTDPVLRAGALAALAPAGGVRPGEVAGMLPQLPQLGLFGRALLLDAALDTDDRASARAIVRSLLSSAEESAGEISFNEQRSDAYASLLATPLRDNCAVLDALSLYKRRFGDQGLLGTTPQKAMRWITARRRNSGGWPNSQENVFCTTAVVHYADAYEPPVRDLGARVTGSAAPARHARFASRGSAPVSLRLPAPAPGSTASIRIARSGHGRLYYQLRLSYAMPPDALAPADAGFSIRRSYAVQRGLRWVPVVPGTVLLRGDVVRVELDVDAPTERHYVVVSDPLPGGFEAVNRQLATAMDSSPADLAGRSVLMFDAGAWPGMSMVSGGFYHRETSFDAVRFYADTLPAGHYRLVYAAQVIAPGRFIAPAPTVREIYEPDVFGRGASQTVDVRLRGSR